MSAHAAPLAAAACAALLICAYGRHRRRRREPKVVHAFVISLGRRPAKRESMLRRVADAGMRRVEVFEAVDGRSLTKEALRARGVTLYPNWRVDGSASRFFSRDLKWGEIGCALSHHAVWAEIVARNLDVALVLEDDMAFAPDFARLLAAAISEADALAAAGTTPPPDLLYVARRPMRPECDVPLPRAGGESGVRLVRPAFSYKAGACVLWRRGAQKLLASGYLEQLIPVDNLLPLLYEPMLHQGADAVAATPDPRRHRRSDIDRVDIERAYAGAPRLHALATRPLIAWERRGLSDTENTAEVRC